MLREGGELILVEILYLNFLINFGKYWERNNNGQSKEEFFNEWEIGIVRGIIFGAKNYRNSGILLIVKNSFEKFGDFNSSKGSQVIFYERIFSFSN